MVGELSTIQTSEKYNALYLSVNVFSTKVLEALTILGPQFYSVIRGRRKSAICMTKAVLLSLLDPEGKSGIELATTRSVVKCSTD